MSEPTFVPLNTGDIRDDDGEVIDSFFIETDAPPSPNTGDPVIRPNATPVKPTRLMTAYAALAAADPAYPLVPPNSYRKELQIIVGPSASTDSVLIGDDPTKLEFPSSAARLLTGGTYDLDAHNGPVWVKPFPGNAAPVYVSYMAVIGG